ncbi:MAG: glycine cleavage system aminomethyltransferase GcvT [Dehalococcoidia bacterium]|nr:glycine cleavage system aminomethyltransferase GcvT [Dehalococcoidia bacterium]
MEGQPQKTPLYDVHLGTGARIVEFAGWLLPVQFRSIVEEHLAVRGSVGAFDISHMAQIRVVGPDVFTLLQGMLTNDLTGLVVGRGQYNLICSDEGTIIDDTYLFRYGPEEYLLVGNAVNAGGVYHRMIGQSKTASLAVKVDLLTGKCGAIAVQGPRALDILRPFADVDLASIPSRQCRQMCFAGADVLVARTGYTGEDGFEVFMMLDTDTVHVWAAVVGAGAMPCGLGARDTLRLEAALPLYGHEIDLTTNPFEAGLGWVVKLDKGEFVGRQALVRIAEEEARRKLVCFQMIERGIPREQYAIAREGANIGHVTSGTYSPTLDKGVGMGYVSTEWAQPGQELEIVIREKTVRAEVVRRPFYRRREGQ